MATDRETLGNAKLITRIVYSMVNNDLMQRTVIKIKDIDGNAQIVSDEMVNLGKKSAYRTLLREQRNQLREQLDQYTKPLADNTSFLEEQIADIGAL